VRGQSETDRGPGSAPAGFAGVYERFFADIHRYIAGRLGPDVADDIAADTFVIALRNYGSFDAGRGQVRGWLFGIATNLVAQHRRAEQRRYRAPGLAGWPAGWSAGTRTGWCRGWLRRGCGRGWPGRWPGCHGRNGTCCCWLPWRICRMKRSRRRSASRMARSARG
jgi:Sigma-70 region 2